MLVMTLARALCPLRPRGDARHVWPPGLLDPARALAFRDKAEEPFGRHARSFERTQVSGAAMKTKIGRVDLVEPGHDDLC